MENSLNAKGRNACVVALETFNYDPSDPNDWMFFRQNS